jgi:hypothetical protein
VRSPRGLLGFGGPPESRRRLLDARARGYAAGRAAATQP